jgi:hypothetical protein
VVAPELPIEDRDATFADYAAAVPDGDLVVGHSMGGITASIVGRRSGARVVYVAALLPRAGVPLAELFGEMMCGGVAAAQERRGDGLRYWRPGEAAAFGLDEAHMRGQAVTPYFDPLDEPARGRYVACARDAVVRPGWQATVADVTLDCGHLPQRECPAALAEVLLDA